MKYRLIKKVINAVYCQIYNTHVEICTDNLYRKIKKLGRGSWIDYPFDIPKPENVSVGDNTKILQNARLDCYANGEDEGHISLGKIEYISW